MKTMHVCLLTLLTILVLICAGKEARAGYWDANPPNNPGVDGPVVAKNGALYTIVGWPKASLVRWTANDGWKTLATFCDPQTDDYGAVMAMKISQNTLYVGGVFNHIYPAGGLPPISITNIAKMNLTTLTWSAVGDGSLIGNAGGVYAIAVDVQNNVYAGFRDVNSYPCSVDPYAPILKKCNGTGAWSVVGDGMRVGKVSYDCIQGITAMAADGTDIYVCGGFTGGYNSDLTYVPSTSVIKWDGTQWRSMGNTANIGSVPVAGIYDPIDPDGTYSISSVVVSGTDVFVAGWYVFPAIPNGLPHCYEGEVAYQPPVAGTGRGLTRFSTSGTLISGYELDLGVGSNPAWGGTPFGLSLAAQPNGKVYVSGAFDAIDGSPKDFIAQWNGTSWSKLDSINGDLLNSPPISEYFRAGGLLAADGANAVYVVGGSDFNKLGPLTRSGSDPSTIEGIGRWVTNPNEPSIATVVGSQSLGGTYSGDGGPALSAGLNGPLGITVYNGSLNIADTFNSAVRVAWGVSQPDGMITSPYQPPYQFDQNYFISPVGVALDSNGYLYVADADESGILQFQGWEQNPNVLGAGSFAALSLAIDGAGTLYFVDEWANYVKTIDPNSGNITIVAGNGQQGFSGDDGSATSAELYVDAYYYASGALVTPSATVDQQGNVYIADMGNNVIRKVDTIGNISTVAGNYWWLGPGYQGDGGDATQAQLSNPAAVAVDAQGNLFIADTGNNVIRRVDHVTGIITTVVGNGQPGYSGDGGSLLGAELNAPGRLVFDGSGNLYISDTGNDVIRKVKF